MLSAEKKFIAALERNRFWLFLILVTAFGIMARMPCLPNQSDDYTAFLQPWFDTIEANGFASLGSQVGEYSITYQFLIVLLTYLPFGSLINYKLLSIVFDYLLAVAVGKLVYVLSGKQDRIIFAAGYAAALLCPTVVMNSAAWAQCDSIYSFFCVMSLCYLYEKKDIRAFVFLGLAFAFKLQAIFIVPVFLYIYFTEKRFSILYFLISIGSFYTAALPGFIFGRDLLAPITIYLDQKSLYHSMTLNIPNLWGIFDGEYQYYSSLAISITLLMYGAALFFTMGKKGIFADPVRFVSLSAWSCWTAAMFLPGMHERYMYLGDILLISLALIRRRYTVIAVSAVLVSIVTYGTYLCDLPTFTRETSILYILLWVVFTMLFFRDIFTGSSLDKNDKGNAD